MLALARPPYLRWAAAIAVLVAAFAIELWPRPVVQHPFAARSIERGTVIGERDVVWRAIAGGPLPPVSLPGVATVDIGRGDPIIQSVVGAGTAVPPTWWSVPVPLPAATPLGVTVRLIDTDTGAAHDGVVTGKPSDDPFAPDRNGLVAVPPDAAASIAVAAASGALTVALSP